MSRSLRPYLEYQADRVEAVLAAHRTPGRVTGGTVGPQLIRFILDPAPYVRLSAIQHLADDLALALRVPTLSIDRGREGVILEFSNPNPQKITLAGLLNDPDAHLAVGQMALGMRDTGTPLCVNIAAPEVGHILISGTTGSGKSVLLLTMAASLIYSAMPAQLRVVCIDPKARTFKPLAGVLHLARQTITEMPEAVEALESLLLLSERRDQRGERPGPTVPRIVIFIDELADLVMQGGERVVATLARIVGRGRQSGVHIVGATQYPSSAILGGMMKANFPLRICGKVVSTDDARVATGHPGTNAHLLNGRGDFLAVVGGESPLRFQAALSDEKMVRALLSAFTETAQDASLRLRSHGGVIQADIVGPAQPAELRQLPEHRLALPRPEPAPLTRVQDAVEVLRPRWPELRAAWVSKEWGIKTRLVQMVWGDDHRYEGAFAEWIEAAVTELENGTVTTTTTSELVPLRDVEKGRVRIGRKPTKATTLARIRRQQESIYAVQSV
jgi:DNA segregation ATPase FtsK/SpoIIIE-like protein